MLRSATGRILVQDCLYSAWVSRAAGGIERVYLGLVEWPVELKGFILG